VAAGDLTTLATVREYLRLEVSETSHDALLTRLITSASDWFKAAVDRQIASASVSETWSGVGETIKYLSEYPVISVASVTVDGSAIPARTTGNGYVYDATTGKLELVGYTFTAGNVNCAVVYTAGWTVVPLDIEQTVVEAVALRFKDRDHVGQAYTVLNGTVTDFRGGGQLPYIQGVIDKYRRGGL